MIFCRIACPLGSFCGTTAVLCHVSCAATKVGFLTHSVQYLMGSRTHYCRRSCNSPWGWRACRGGPGHREGAVFPPVWDGGPMARRTFDVIDVAEILVHWHAGRSLNEMSQSLGVDRKTLRKYVARRSRPGSSRAARRGAGASGTSWSAWHPRTPTTAGAGRPLVPGVLTGDTARYQSQNARRPPCWPDPSFSPAPTPGGGRRIQIQRS
jgi:hypothetical protein